MGLLVCGWAHAEQGCAPGFFPGGTQPNGPVCVPIPGYGTTNATTSSSAPAHVPEWATRWGAIAIDETNSGVGVAAGMSSKRRAEKAAMKGCRAKGGSACKINLIYQNQCAVIAWGDTQASVLGAATIQEASDVALEDCGKRTSNCRIYYADCSLPERIQ